MKMNRVKKMKRAILTGESRGLGSATAKILLDSGIEVIGISRSFNKTLQLFAEKNQVLYEHITCDLTNEEQANKIIDEVVERYITKDVSTLYIINNAAMIEPIHQSTEMNLEQLQSQLYMNVVVPMILLNKSLARSTNQEISCVGVNVTSGAGKRPIYGFSGYCSSKAALDMYTKTVAIEQEALGKNQLIIGFSPGLMDTFMQEEIRSKKSVEFLEVETFRQYKTENKLHQIEEIAGILVDIITDESSIINGKIYNVRDYL